MTDTVHTTVGFLALALVAYGARTAWGAGYACLLVGSLLLAGVIYARTRQ